MKSSKWPIHMPNKGLCIASKFINETILHLKQTFLLLLIKLWQVVWFYFSIPSFATRSQRSFHGTVGKGFWNSQSSNRVLPLVDSLSFWSKGLHDDCCSLFLSETSLVCAFTMSVRQTYWFSFQWYCTRLQTPELTMILQKFESPFLFPFLYLCANRDPVYCSTFEWSLADWLCIMCILGWQIQ